MPTPLPNPKKPDALELFTDRVEEQRVLRAALQPAAAAELDKTRLLTVFYGVGGVGKTTLCQMARKIAQEEFSGRVTCAGTSFDDARWKPDSQFTEVAAEICRCCAHVGIPLPMTFALLALYAQHTGDTTGGGLDNNWALALDALDKGVEMAGIPGLALLVKGAQWVRERSQRQALRQRLNEFGLWPEEQHGRINVSDLEGKLATALFYDTVGWLQDHPDKNLRLLLDGFERLQSHERRADSQKRLQEFIGYFAGSHEPEACARFRVVLFGREKLRWDDLYQDPGWNECGTQHLLGGLAEDDARDFLRKTQAWLRSHGQSPLAEALARNEDKILDAADENLRGQRVCYPFYLNLAVELVERARQNGTDPDLGRAPAELQDRFFRYLDQRELRALKILALAEVFDDALYDWLARERLVEFPAHSFHTELRQEHSYFQPVDGSPGDWKFHRLFEDALHARWQSTEAERTEGRQVVGRLLDYHGSALKQKPERDWTETDVESWRRGMEIIVKQGPELGLLPQDDWEALREQWSIDHYRGITHQVDFTRRILQAQERILDPEHPDTLNSVHNLAGLLHQRGEYEGAEALCRRALAVREKVLGAEHLDTLSSLQNLGVLLRKRGDYDGAEACYRRALAGTEKALGAEHPETLSGVHCLANLLCDKADYEGAESCYRRALAGYEKALGTEHPTTLLVVHNYGRLFSKRGDYEGAEALYRRALAGYEKALGAEHPDTLKTLDELGYLLSKKGDSEGAAALCRRALAGLENVLGAEHPDTLCSASNLAAMLSKTGNHKEAEVLCRLALAGMEEALGVEHRYTLLTVTHLGDVLRNKGDYEGAMALYQRALGGCERSLGSEHPTTLHSVNNLSFALRHRGDLGGAVSLLREFANKSPECLIGVRYNLACYECLSGNMAEAKRLITEEIAAKPAARELALKDDDLNAIHEFIRCLPIPADEIQKGGKA